jgi:hypothetical protein
MAVDKHCANADPCKGFHQPPIQCTALWEKSILVVLVLHHYGSGVPFFYRSAACIVAIAAAAAAIGTATASACPAFFFFCSCRVGDPTP